MIVEFFAITKLIALHPLNANHKIQSLLNFMRWQVGIRILKRKVIVPWVGESKFITGIGETGLTGNIYVGLMEYEDMLFLLHALEPSETFVDVGANIGAYTILASKVVGANSIAFEPLPKTFNRLKDQIQINRIGPSVDLRNIGIGNAKGELFFTNNGDTINKVSLAGKVKNTTRVEVSTLDDELVAGLHYFLKIDVEGFEYNVIEGTSKILSTENISAIIIELNSSGVEFGHSNEEIHQKILSFNFIPISYNPISRRITKLGSYNKNRGNTIYIKDIYRVAERCKAAPKRIIHTAYGLEI